MENLNTAIPLQCSIDKRLRVPPLSPDILIPVSYRMYFILKCTGNQLMRKSSSSEENTPRDMRILPGVQVWQRADFFSCISYRKVPRLAVSLICPVSYGTERNGTEPVFGRVPLCPRDEEPPQGEEQRNETYLSLSFAYRRGRGAGRWPTTTTTTTTREGNGASFRTVRRKWWLYIYWPTLPSFRLFPSAPRPTASFRQAWHPPGRTASPQIVPLHTSPLYTSSPWPTKWHRVSPFSLCRGPSPPSPLADPSCLPLRAAVFYSKIMSRRFDREIPATRIRRRTKTSLMKMFTRVRHGTYFDPRGPV